MERNNFDRRQFVKAVSVGSLAGLVLNSVPVFAEAKKENDKLNFANIDDQSWVEIDNVLYGAKANDLGQIGGGSRYKNIITKGDYIITDHDALLESLMTKSEYGGITDHDTLLEDIIKKGEYTVTNVDNLLASLAKAKAGQVVFIPSETFIDLTTLIYIDELVLEVPEGVTLAGDRGYNGSRGALLASDATKTRVIIKAGGPNVRITGLRIQGPHPRRYIDNHRKAFGPDPYTSGLGGAYYNKFPTSNGIVSNYNNLEVDNCEISAFSNGGINLNKTTNGHHIHHNYIHKCQRMGLGYGVVLEGATALIEYNMFNENRHSIAGTGRAGEGYIARHNIEMGISLSHCFDMHGGRDRKDGTEIAGRSIEIYNNTFYAPTRAVAIRGVPQEECKVHNNWFQKHGNSGEAVRSEKNTTIFNNVYGAKPTVAI
ncbi:MAG: hypothetical protein ABIP35_04165 [Ginsengibacter sp.]